MLNDTATKEAHLEVWGKRDGEWLKRALLPREKGSYEPVNLCEMLT